MPKVYNLELFVNNCLLEVNLNGFKVLRIDAKNGYSQAGPINTELIGTGNILSVTILPTVLNDGTMTKLSDVKILGTIKRYDADEFTGPESGEVVTDIDFTDILNDATIQSLSVTDMAKLFPLRKLFSFDSEGIAFRNRFVDAPQIIDQKSILTYGEIIRDLLAANDLQGLLSELTPKITDYGLAYPTELPDPYSWFKEFFQKDFFPGGPITDFKRADVGLQSWCEGRLWELYIKPTQQFFSNVGLDGDINTIEVYVGLVDNQLKIIR